MRLKGNSLIISIKTTIKAKNKKCLKSGKCTLKNRVK